MDTREKFADMSVKYGLIVVRPKDREDFRNDSLELRHNACMSFWDRYVNREIEIFFVRRIDNPNKPFYTMVVTNNTINVFRGAYNSIPDNQVAAFVREWADANGIDCAFISRKGA